MSFFFFNDTATTEIYTLSLHDALPISRSNAFTRTVTSSATGTTRSVVENGVRSVVGSADQIQLLDTTQTDYTYGSGATASHARKRSEEHTSELQSQSNLVCRLLLEKKKTTLA